MMKKSSKKTRTFFLLIIIMVLFFSSQPVKALSEEEQKQLNSMMCIRTNNQEWSTASFIDYSYNNGIVTLSLNKDALKILDNPPEEFKLIRVLETKMNDAPPSYFYLLYNNINIGKYFGSNYVDYNTPQKIGSAANQTLTATKNVSLKVNANKHIYFVFASTTNYEFKEDENCKVNGKEVKEVPLYIYLSADIYAGGETVKPTGTYIKTNPDAEMTKVNCSINYPDNTFEANYCNDYKKAVKSGAKSYNFGVTQGETVVSYADYMNNLKKDNVITFQCDPFQNLPSQKKSKEYYLSQNTKYLIGNATNVIKVGTYVFNYGGQFKEGDCYNENGRIVSCDLGGAKKIEKDSPLIGTSTNPSNIKRTDIKCSVDCTEVVTVQYGSPVASKAGLCFEYKVKVTSRVTCGSKIIGTAEPPANKYCTGSAYCWDPNPPAPEPSGPGPQCDNSDCDAFYGCDTNPHQDTCSQDGPNDQFDTCINKCDGGKYTLACSYSCLDQVYGKEKTLFKSTYAADFTNYAEKVLNEKRKKKGCENAHYSTNASGEVIFMPDGCIAPIYNELDDRPCVKDHTAGGGIPCYCSCTLRCKWDLPAGCSVKTDYLNKGEYERDQKKNQDAYDSATKKCASFTKCSTSTATFTINANYSYLEDKEIVKRTVYFPYTQANNGQTTDTAQYRDKSVACTNKNSNTTLIPIKENQCYNCQGTDANGSISMSRTYMMEWSFPGVWVNGKSKSISYTRKAGWYKVGGQFCVPINARDVNRHWWNLYFIDDINNNKGAYASNSSADNAGCSMNFSQCETISATSFEKDKIDWNINASTRKFGLFGWNIDIKCFYSLNSNFPKYERGSSCPSSCPNSGYSVRSVNLDNLFPEEKNGKVLSDPSTTGRAAGFNWTGYAQNEKTTDFESNPEAYRTWIQTVKYDIYNDAYADRYLDYDIYLTKDEIQTIRSMKANLRGFNSIDDIGTNDDTLNTEAYIGNKSMLFYQSDLIRKVLKHVNKKPEGNAMYCNNIKNSNSCFIPGVDN